MSHAKVIINNLTSISGPLFVPIFYVDECKYGKNLYTFIIQIKTYNILANQSSDSMTGLTQIILRKIIKGYLDSTPLLTFNTIKT